MFQICWLISNICKYLQDAEGRTILHYLAGKKDGEATARKFLERLKEKDKLFIGRNFVSLTNNQGQSCVHLASQAGYLEFLALLLENHPELDAADNAGLTGLHLSVLSGEAGAGCLPRVLPADLLRDEQRLPLHRDPPAHSALLRLYYFLRPGVLDR